MRHHDITGDRPVRVVCHCRLIDVPSDRCCSSPSNALGAWCRRRRRGSSRQPASGSAWRRHPRAPAGSTGSWCRCRAAPPRCCPSRRSGQCYERTGERLAGRHCCVAVGAKNALGYERWSRAASAELRLEIAPPAPGDAVAVDAAGMRVTHRDRDPCAVASHRCRRRLGCAGSIAQCTAIQAARALITPAEGGAVHVDAAAVEPAGAEHGITLVAALGRGLGHAH
jgi:hypothetical protein